MLIDWQRVAESETQVIHVVDAIASDDNALTLVQRMRGSELLRRTEDDLILLELGSHSETAILQSEDAERTVLAAQRVRFDGPQLAEELAVGLRGSNWASARVSHAGTHAGGLVTALAAI